MPAFIALLLAVFPIFLILTAMVLAGGMRADAQRRCSEPRSKYFFTALIASAFRPARAPAQQPVTVQRNLPAARQGVATRRLSGDYRESSRIR